MVNPAPTMNQRSPVRITLESEEVDRDAATAPVISVLIPCYNEEAFIADCIESVICDFVLRNCEILVIDGGSAARFIVDLVAALQDLSEDVVKL